MKCIKVTLIIHEYDLGANKRSTCEQQATLLLNEGLASSPYRVLNDGKLFRRSPFVKY